MKKEIRALAISLGIDARYSGHERTFYCRVPSEKAKREFQKKKRNIGGKFKFRYV